MKLHVINTSRGLLIPETDEDYEKKGTLQIGKTYSVDIRLVRNPDFHRKYFAMLNCAWSLLPQSVQEGFRSRENFRKYVQIAAGFSEPFFHPTEGFIDMPKSIDFESMDELEFQDLYQKVRTVIDSIVQRYITTEQFEKTLMNF